MTALWLLLCLALAADPAPVTLSGFDRVRMDVQTQVPAPTTPSPGTDTLMLHNPFTTRVVVHIGEIAVGELLPKATGTLTGVPAGLYTLRWQLPAGPQRTTTTPTESLREA